MNRNNKIEKHISRLKYYKLMRRKINGKIKCEWKALMALFHNDEDELKEELKRRKDDIE